MSCAIGGSKVQQSERKGKHIYFTREVEREKENDIIESEQEKKRARVKEWKRER
jgi:hypothetical protein